MTTPQELVDQAAHVIAHETGVDHHDVAVVLGSGWGAVADRCGEVTATLAPQDIPGFHAPQVPGHRAMVRSVQLLPPASATAVASRSARALLIGSRTHLYEGLGVASVIHPILVAAAAGCHTVILTNGAGSLHRHWAPGTVVLLRDHLNLTGKYALSGPSFVDLTDAYDPSLRRLIHREIPGIPEGVYAQFHGPQYETPAEIKMAGVLGADVVGMSTTVETVAARSVGMRVVGLSLVTNLAAGLGESSLDHQEVIEAGRQSEERLAHVLGTVLQVVGSCAPTGDNPGS